MKLILTLYILFFSMVSYSQQTTKYDTVVRKKYLDSVKYQLSLYTLSSYTYLNMYDRAENQKDSVIRRLNDADKFITKYRQYHRRSNIRSGIMILSTFVLSFVMVSVFNK